ncbi:DUF2271 domain-containing protein [Deinococcus sp. UYEF24]
MTKPTIDRRSFLGKTAAAALGLALSRFNTAGAATAKAAVTFDAKMELAVNFSIVNAGGFRFQRPYVAVWLEDAAGNEVRTLSVWAKTDARGQRYLEHLTRWTGAAGSRQDTLLSTVSSPTRNPGSYTLVWDGKNDAGALVAQGDYFLCVESAREHGPYALIREKVTVSGAASTRKLAGNGDIGDVNASYRKRA